MPNRDVVRRSGGRECGGERSLKESVRRAGRGRAVQGQGGWSEAGEARKDFGISRKQKQRHAE